MREALQDTVYVTTQGASRRKDGANRVAEVHGANERASLFTCRHPWRRLGSDPSLSPALIGACAASGITIVLLDRRGRFQARVEGPVSGNVLLRRAQYRVSEAPAEIVRSLVIGKVANQRAVLMRALRDHGEDYASGHKAAIDAVVDRLANIIARVERKGDGTDAMRGSEGEAANLYFSVFDHLILSRAPELRWTVRSRRPPLDPVNALLSFLYTLLTHDCRSAAEAAGLDPAVGFLHRDRPGRPSLALDLMEELRPALGRPTGAFADQSPTASARRFRHRGKRRCSPQGRKPKNGAVRLAGAQKGRAPTPLP